MPHYPTSLPVLLGHPSALPEGTSRSRARFGSKSSRSTDRSPIFLAASLAFSLMLPAAGQAAASDPTIIISPEAAVAFGQQPVGATSRAEKVTLTNAGSSTVTISRISIDGDFKRVASTCGQKLAPGESCMLHISFTPMAGGERVGELSIVDGSLAGAHKLSLTGTGAGTCTDSAVTEVSGGLSECGAQGGAVITLPEVVEEYRVGTKDLTGIARPVLAASMGAIEPCQGDGLVNKEISCE